MIDLLLYVVAVIALLFASISDFRKNEVPDWISYGFLFSVLGIRLVYSVFSLEFMQLVSGISGAIVFFAISYLLYLSSQWGGGDVKMMAGVGAVLGLSKSSLLFAVLIIFLGAVYGIGWSIYLAISNKQKFSKEFKILFSQVKFLVISAAFLCAVSFMILFWNYSTVVFLVFGLSLILLFGLISYSFVKSVEDCSLIKKISPSKLTEGDWTAEPILIKGRIAIPKNTALTIEQIKRLKQIKKTVSIKQGIPFVPVFLLSFTAVVLFKDVLLTFL